MIKMHLAQFIDSNSESILVEWEAFARTILPAAAQMDVKALRDHAEKMLRAITEDMQSSQSPEEQRAKSRGQRPNTAQAITQAAHEHATDRHGALFSLDQLVSEYRALRASVITLWADQIGANDRAALDELTRFNEAMDQALGVSVAAFTSRVNHMLAMADRRKDEFLATLAHELRNPLAPIKAAARVAKSPNVTEAQLQWSHDVIDRQVQHMARLLDDLLDVSRLTQGKLDMRRERVELAAIIDTALETATPIIDLHGHHLSVTLPNEAVNLDADALRLAQAFANILINAAKYTEPNGHIALSGFVEESAVVVSVRDSGIGIAPEMLASVFDMFSQATSALDCTGGGLGIGLAVVRGVVELHGGSVKARSEGLGRGSEFTIRLPLPQPAKKQAMKPGKKGQADSRPEPRKIVVVDDNRDAVESLTLLLNLDGHEVLGTQAGDHALELAASARPEVILLDIGMPKMNGYEVAKRIRAEPWGARITLIAVTGWGQIEDVQRAKAAGFDHHLTKPIDHDDLRSLLRKLA
jgi:signal transduction histidine kinase/CheY-like chemotaxis protein